MLLKGWWIILLTLLVAVGVAYVASMMTDPVYRSSARFIVSPNPIVNDNANLLRSLDTLDRTSIINTYAQVFGSNRIYGQAVDALGLDRENLAGYEVTAVGLPESNVLQVSVVGKNPDTVHKLVGQIGSESIAYVQELYFLYDVTLLDPASVPSRPISPNVTRNLSVAAVLGLVLGIGLALLYDIFSHHSTLSTLAHPVHPNVMPPHPNVAPPVSPVSVDVSSD